MLGSSQDFFYPFYNIVREKRALNLLKKVKSSGKKRKGREKVFVFLAVKVNKVQVFSALWPRAGHGF